MEGQPIAAIPSFGIDPLQRGRVHLRKLLERPARCSWFFLLQLFRGEDEVPDRDSLIGRDHRLFEVKHGH